MQFKRNKKILIILMVLLAGAIFWKIKSASPSSPPIVPVENQPPQIVSTKPNPLDNTVVAQDEEIEIVFNRSLENEGELKVRIEPKIEFKKSLSADRKTARITFEKPLELGTSYTLFITGDTKFDGVGSWGQEKNFHFQTIKFRGV